VYVHTRCRRRTLLLSCTRARKQKLPGVARLRIHHIWGCPAAAFLQKLPGRRSANLRERFGLLAVLIDRFEYLRDFHRKIRRPEGEREERIFVFGGPKPKILLSKDRSRRARRRQREPYSLCSPFRSSCEKISIVRGGLDPAQQLLRVELRRGSPAAARSR
jgi:hypothetical protein